MFKSVRSRLPVAGVGVKLIIWTLCVSAGVVPVMAQSAPVAPVPAVDGATALLDQGRILYETGRLAEAVTVWQQAAAHYENERDRPRQALSFSYLSLAYQDLGDWEQAERAIAQSLELIATVSPQPTTGTNSVQLSIIRGQILNAQGSLQLATGQTEAALNTWQQSQSAYAAAGDRMGVLGAQMNQSQALQTLGLYRRSRTLLEQINQPLQTEPDSTLKALSLRSLGIALQVVGDLTESQKILTQSLVIFQRLAANSPNLQTEISLVLFSLGNTERGLKNYPAALQYYQQAATTATSAIAKLEAQLNGLSLLLEMEDWTAARNLLPQIQNNLAQAVPSRLSVYARVNLAESLMNFPTPDTPPPEMMAQILATGVKEARSLKDQRAESYALVSLGKLYAKTQQWSEAQNLTQAALQIAQTINASDITARTQAQLGKLLKQQGETKRAIAAYTEAVNTLQSIRSDLVAINPDIQFSFRDSVEPIYRELVGLLLQPNATQADLIQAREVIESLQLAELDNFFRDACLDVQPQPIDQIDPSAAAIYPIILPDRLEVILSVPGQPLRHYGTALPQREVESVLEQLLESLNPAFSSQMRLRLSQQVYEWLIQPAEASLSASEIKTLVFVLDGALRNLPMAALYDGEKYLVEKYNVALTPGLQLLEPRSLAQAKIQALTAGLTDGRSGFSPLPAVQLEVQEIAAQVPTEILLNQEFTESNLQTEVARRSFNIIHLATHGQFSSNPEETFILTWDEKVQVREFEKLLQARDRSEEVPIELLILSACQTAAGDNRATLGLAGVAVRSGARSTVATLWSVNDQSTANLMAAFYRELSQPEVNKAEALRRAQLSLLQSTHYNHPFYWAPFILVGNWL